MLGDQKKKIDFVMDVLAAFYLVKEVNDKEKWRPLVEVARACDPGNFSLEHVLARVEWESNNKIDAVFHYLRASACANLTATQARRQQAYAFDAAKAAVELVALDIPLTFPLHPNPKELLEQVARILEAALSREASGGRLEVALVEVRLLQGQVRAACQLLGDLERQANPEIMTSFPKFLGRLLLVPETVRETVKRNLMAVVRHDDVGEMAAALLYRLYRQDGDKEGIHWTQRLRPTAAESFPWIAGGVREIAEGGQLPEVLDRESEGVVQEEAAEE